MLQTRPSLNSLHIYPWYSGIHNFSEVCGYVKMGNWLISNAVGKKTVGYTRTPSVLTLGKSDVWPDVFRCQNTIFNFFTLTFVRDKLHTVSRVPRISTAYWCCHANGTGTDVTNICLVLIYKKVKKCWKYLEVFFSNLYYCSFWKNGKI